MIKQLAHSERCSEAVTDLEPHSSAYKDPTSNFTSCSHQTTTGSLAVLTAWFWGDPLQPCDIVSFKNCLFGCLGVSVS